MFIAKTFFKKIPTENDPGKLQIQLETNLISQIK